ncbi:hypothetical protein [Roseivirga pacifica]|uniref:hypothetical protein n=1 Tax=Roseivirga pacifica TaxID=1267423 RepID=UPI003BAF9CBA
MARTSFFTNILNGVDKLVKLEVSTIIGTFKPNSTLTAQDLANGNAQDAMMEQIDLNDAMLSKVNMLTGDITTTMTQRFTNDQQLREYHSIRENQAHEIVLRNVKVLESVGKMIIDFAEKEVDPRIAGGNTPTPPSANGDANS